MKTREFKVGWRGHKRSCYNSMSSTQWAGKLLIPSGWLQAWWKFGWGGEEADSFGSRCSESVKLSLENRYDANSMTLRTVLSSWAGCNYFLIISSSPLECSASTWSQKFRENQNPLPQILKHQLDYVIPCSNTFSGFLLPFILRRWGLFKSSYTVVRSIWCPSNRIKLLEGFGFC